MGVRTLVPEADRTVSSRTGLLLSAHRWPQRVLASVLIGLVAYFSAALPVGAQDETNSLREIVPADGAVLTLMPKEIVLSFNQELADDDKVTLQATCNSKVVTFDREEIEDDVRARFKIVSVLERGLCTISWTLVNAEGTSIADGSSSFSINADAVPGSETTTTIPGGTSTIPLTTQPAAASAAPADAADADNEGSYGAAIWFFRLLSTLAIMVMFGAITVIGTGWVEGVEYTITTGFIRRVWIASVVTTLLYVVFVAADLKGGSIGSGLSPLAWFDLLNDGWSGIGTVLRLIAVVAAGYAALVPERIIDAATAMFAWLIPGIATMTLALTRIEGPLAPIGFVVGIVHVLASAIWLGGAVFIAVVVLAGPGEEDLVVATRTYSRFSVAAIAVTVVTGLIEMIRLDGASLFSTGHGRVLLLKVVAVAAMLFVGMAARQQVGIRLARAHEMTVQSAHRFRRAFGAEVAVGVVVLALSGWMLSFSVGAEVPWSDETYEITQPINDQNTGLQATVWIGPLTVGKNGYLVQVVEPQSGITNMMIRFKPPAGTQNGQASIVEEPIRLNGPGSVYRLTSDGLPLSVPGQWTVELDVTTSQSTQTLQFPVTVAQGDGSTVPTASSSTSQVSVPVETVALENPNQVQGDIATTTTTIPPPTSSTVAG